RSGKRTRAVPATGSTWVISPMRIRFATSDSSAARRCSKSNICTTTLHSRNVHRHGVTAGDLVRHLVDHVLARQPAEALQLHARAGPEPGVSHQHQGTGGGPAVGLIQPGL